MIIKKIMGGWGVSEAHKLMSNSLAAKIRQNYQD